MAHGRYRRLLWQLETPALPIAEDESQGLTSVHVAAGANINRRERQIYREWFRSWRVVVGCHRAMKRCAGTSAVCFFGLVGSC